jgi:hypothetical protein
VTGYDGQGKSADEEIHGQAVVASVVAITLLAALVGIGIIVLVLTA